MVRSRSVIYAREKSLRLLDYKLCQPLFVFPRSCPDWAYILTSNGTFAFHRIRCVEADGDVPTFSRLSKY